MPQSAYSDMTAAFRWNPAFQSQFLQKITHSAVYIYSHFEIKNTLGWAGGWCGETEN